MNPATPPAPIVGNRCRGSIPSPLAAAIDDTRPITPACGS